jgi:hypothetical protein
MRGNDVPGRGPGNCKTNAIISNLKLAISPACVRIAMAMSRHLRGLRVERLAITDCKFLYYTVASALAARDTATFLGD